MSSYDSYQQPPYHQYINTSNCSHCEKFKENVIRMKRYSLPVFFIYFVGENGTEYKIPYFIYKFSKEKKLSIFFEKERVLAKKETFLVFFPILERETSFFKCGNGIMETFKVRGKVLLAFFLSLCDTVMAAVGKLNFQKCFNVLKLHRYKSL